MSKLTNETKAGLRSATRLIHAGRDPEDQYGFVNTPIYRGSTVLFPTMASLKDRNIPFPLLSHYPAFNDELLMTEKSIKLSS